jgi:hypothetical protein
VSSERYSNYESNKIITPVIVRGGRIRADIEGEKDSLKQQAVMPGEET